MKQNQSLFKTFLLLLNKHYITLRINYLPDLQTSSIPTFKGHVLLLDACCLKH